MTSNAIEIQHLVKRYETGAGPVRVLNDVSLTVQPGDVIVAGPRLNALSENQMAHWRGRCTCWGKSGWLTRRTNYPAQ